MPERKIISVIIPCHNSSEYLPKCYASLIAQTIGIEQIEMIFVDDASTDEGKTWDLLLEYEKEHPESVMVIHLEENMRQGGARNVAMQYASGEYIIFCDSDDWFDETALEKTYAAAKKMDADVVQFLQYYYVNEKDVRPYISADDNQNRFYEIKTAEERRDFIQKQIMTPGHNNKLYRRDWVLASGARFAEHTTYEEPLFTYPLSYAVERFVFLKDYLYYYRYNTNGTVMHDMNAAATLTDHISVQLQLQNTMENSKYYAEFKNEIDIHFIHSYLYETIYFAKIRNFPDVYTIFKHLAGIIRNHWQQLGKNPYLQNEECRTQRQLLELALHDASREEFEEFFSEF
jgi:glycosyltransferase involved in cell wall biosynthesis